MKQERKTNLFKNFLIRLLGLFSCLMLLASCFILSPSWAADEDPQTDQDPAVEITPSKGFGAKKIFLFPLELPVYAIKGITLPLQLLGQFSEKHHLGERIYDLLTDDQEAFFIYPNIEVGTGSGFGGGIGMSHNNVFGQHYDFELSFIIFEDLDHRASMSFSGPPRLYLFSRPVSFEFKTSWLRDSDADFYQPGNTSAENSKSEFGTNDFQARLIADYEVVPTFVISPHVGIHQASTRTAKNTANSVENNFPASDLPGFGRKLTHINFGLTLAHDDRDDENNPSRGGYRAYTFSRVQGIGNSGFNYNQHKLEIRQYFPLWKPRYVLVLNTAWIFQQETGSSQVPFNQLATLDVFSPLRSFDTGRFRDHGVVVFNVQYRYPVWDFIDGVLFFDTGRVFDDLSDFAFKNFKYSVGGGIHLVTRSNLLFGIYTAYGSDGTNVVFKVKQAL